MLRDLFLRGELSLLIVAVDFVIKSQTILKDDALTFSLKALHQSPRLLQISIIPVFALECPYCKNNVIESINLPYLDLIFF